LRHRPTGYDQFACLPSAYFCAHPLSWLSFSSGKPSMSSPRRKLLIVGNDEAIRTQLNYVLRDQYATNSSELRVAGTST